MPSTHRVGRDVGLGYTLATGRLFCDMGEFHAFAEKVAGHPIFTHEFAFVETWDELREKYEALVTELGEVPA